MNDEQSRYRTNYLYTIYLHATNLTRRQWTWALSKPSAPMRRCQKQPDLQEFSMPVQVIYTTEATATGGRDGRARTKDGTFDVTLATPKELGGGGGPGNNPEQLFAAGYAACFLNALKFVASQGGPKVPADTSVTSTVGIGPRSAGGFGLDIDLAVSLPGLSRADAEALVQKAHQVCPYSNATRGNVDVRLKVV